MPQRRSAAKLRGLAQAGDGKLAPYGARVRRELVQPGFGRAAIVRPRELPTGRLDLIMLQGAATPAKGALAKEGAEAPREPKKKNPTSWCGLPFHLCRRSAEARGEAGRGCG